MKDRIIRPILKDVYEDMEEFAKDLFKRNSKNIVLEKASYSWEDFMKKIDEMNALLKEDLQPMMEVDE